MNRSTGTPTKAHLARFAALRDLGCIACRLNGAGHAFAEIHHFLAGTKRIGHEATVPLCSWHHQGVGSGIPCALMLETYGPSFHKHTRAFRARYGSDAELLETVNRLIEAKA